MTLFQTFHNDVFLVNQQSQIVGTLKPGTVFHGKRIDEYHISTRDFGPLKIYDEYHMCCVVKEKNAYIDAEWRLKLPRGVFAHTEDGAHSFFIPQDQIATVYRRSIFENTFCYLVEYKHHLGYIRQARQEKTPWLPLRQHLLIQIISPDGCVVHTTKEIDSTPCGLLPYKSFAIVCEKDWSELPAENHIPRLKLLDGGWLSCIPYSVQIIGSSTPSLKNKYSTNIFSTCFNLNTFKNPGTCFFCLENDINASFIHGENAHSISCLSCAENWFSKDKSCPVCRTRVEKVVLNFTR